MKRTLTFYMLSLALVFTACNSSSKQEEEKKKFIPLEKMNLTSLDEEIGKREKALNEDTANVNRQLAAQLMEAYVVYAERFPNYEEAADRLFKAGELAMGLGHKVQSIKYFDKVYNDFRDYEKRPYALFMKAFVLENQAMQYDQAKEVYEKFLSEFPSHPMADDAEYSIKNMGKSPEELIREFERRDSLEKAQKKAAA
ncbi:MAG: tetratricopeptide repeat protein [Vicingaceae bacterium]